MKFSTVVAASLCAAVASAVPTQEKRQQSYGSYSPYASYGNYGNPASPPTGGSGGSNTGSAFTFTSTFRITATPNQVVNNSNVATGGLQGATGYFDFGINRFTDTICYNITLINVRGDYSSPASTATHIHQSARGQSGPPRIAFPNPVGNDAYRNSIGCLKGPFRTGLNGTDGRDTGIGFTVAQIEANPAAFNADTHTTLAVPGAVRGQFA